MSAEATEGTSTSSSVRDAQRRIGQKCAGLKAFMTGRVFWFGLPKPPHEHLVSVDHFFIWRRHLIWAKRDGNELRNILTQRYASSTIFLSLLLSTELGVLFSPSDPAKFVREDLEGEDHSSLGFYTGIVLCISIFMAIAGLISAFTAWSIFASLSGENVHIVLRSTLGLYAAQLPSNIIMLAIYCFFTWIVLFWYIIMPLGWAIFLNMSGIILIMHVVSTYSALGRVIMHTGAMGGEPVLGRRAQESKTPNELYKILRKKTKTARKAKIPVYRQYRIPYQQSLYDLSRGMGTEEVLRAAGQESNVGRSKEPSADHDDRPSAESEGEPGSGSDAGRVGGKSSDPPPVEPSDTAGLSLEEDP